MKIIGILIVSAELFLFGCKDQYLELDKNPLKGKIEGKEWVFGSGWVKYDPVFIQGLYGILFEPKLTDPCTRVTTTESHMAISIPYDRGTYNLPFAQNYFYVNFSVDGAKSYQASSGFIQIVSISSFEIIGFISANFDDDNNVEGSFSLRLCD